MEFVLTKTNRPGGIGDGSWASWRHVALLVAGFAALYVSTRSSILIGDGLAFVATARGGDPAHFQFANFNHFLQVPLARAVWQMLGRIGLTVPPEYVFVGISLIGTLAAMIFLGLIAAKILGTPVAGWVAALLFGTSLHSWTQWNGEQYGLALAFVTSGLLLALRGRVVAPAVLWMLSVLAHAEFTLAAPAFALGAWMARPQRPRGERLRSAFFLMVAAGLLTLACLLLGTWALGKWTSTASLVAWVRHVLTIDRMSTVQSPEVTRAIKGLVTAFTVAGHYWRDILTGRSAFSHAGFLAASIVGSVVLCLTGILVAFAVPQRRLFVFALTWLVPFHVVVNWWWIPTVEKYHAGALPGFVLLVTGGLLFLSSKLPARRGAALCIGFVLTCAALNLFGAVLPMQALGRDTEQATRQVRRLNAGYGGRVVLVTCDGGNVPAVVDADVEYLRIRSIWKGSVAEIQDAIRSWTRARVAEGKVPHVLDRWCYPEEWGTSWSKKPFDQFFLGGQYRLTPTSVTSVPLAQPSTTDPFTWRRGDIVRLDPAGGSQ